MSSPSVVTKETVNAALRDYVARIKRVEAAEKRGARGEFEAAAAAHVATKRARRAAFE